MNSLSFCTDREREKIFELRKANQAKRKQAPDKKYQCSVL